MKIIISLFVLALTSTTANAVKLTDQQQHAVAKYNEIFVNQVTKLSETIVPGMYAYYNNEDKYIRMMAPDGVTLITNPSLVSVIEFDSQGNPINQRQFNKSQIAAMRNEVLSEINTDDLITLKFGNGKEKMFLYSAIDCAACASQEKALIKTADKYNATVYIIPTTLKSNNWHVVNKIMCSDDRASAWRDFWKTKKTPSNNGKCAWSKKHLRKAISFTANFLGTNGTPNIILANGEKIVPSATRPIPMLGSKYPSDDGIFGNNFNVETNYFYE